MKEMGKKRLQCREKRQKAHGGCTVLYTYHLGRIIRPHFKCCTLSREMVGDESFRHAVSVVSSLVLTLSKVGK